MAEVELVGTGIPLPRIVSVRPLDGRVLRIGWKSGESQDVDVEPALLSHRAYVRLRTDDDLFRSAHLDEFGDAVVWNDGSELAATWIHELSAPSDLTNDEFRQAMDGLQLSLDGMATRLGVARRLIADYRKDRPIPRSIALATRYLVEHYKRAG